MAKIIQTIAIKGEPFEFDDIVSFQTKGYVGLWDFAHDNFIIMPKDDIEFSLITLSKNITNLYDLDCAVFHSVGQHLTNVYDRAFYTIKLDMED